ncbi:MAG: methylmalonyl-CoA mutase, partial [Acidobacteriota bacterium]|nr:methylmalonyl-CoA mutase [Acidobacteriota bacterium]
GGGIIPDEDIEELKNGGVAEIFLPGTSTEKVLAWVREHVRSRSMT